jgi:hypothetical protein
LDPTILQYSCTAVKFFFDARATAHLYADQWDLQRYGELPQNEKQGE